MGGADGEEVVMQKREKRKSKKNKKTESSVLEIKSVYEKTATALGEDNGVVSGISNKRSKKIFEKERKMGESKDMDYQFNEEVLINDDENHSGAKNEKNRKLECKANKSSNYKESPNGKGQVGGLSTKKSLDVNTNDEDLKNEIVLEQIKDKRQKKEKRNMNKKCISSSYEVEGMSDIKEREEGCRQKKKKEKKGETLKDKEIGENKGSKSLKQCSREGIKESEESDNQKKKNVEKNRKIKEYSDVEYPNKRSSDEVSTKRKKNIVSNQELREKKDQDDADYEEILNCKGTRKSKGKKTKDDSAGDSREFLTEKSIGEGKTHLNHKDGAYDYDHYDPRTKKKRDREEEVLDVVIEKRTNRKKAKSAEKKKIDMADPQTESGGGSKTDHSRNSECDESSKRIKFSDHVEIFLSSDVTNVGDEYEEEKLVRGKRFSKEEDAMIKDAVLNYVEEHNLGENGVEMVLHCQKYPEVRHCWKEIGAALPWRPQTAIYCRAHILFERAEARTWTEEEKAFIMKFHEKHGPDWKAMAAALGKNRYHVKDTWRRIKVSQLKKGHWSQGEYQALFDLVNMDLRMQVFEEKKSKYGLLRDNIRWGAIGTKLSTRTDMSCCIKWYDQLTSPMVKAGEWADADDYRLLDELLLLDACCVEDVDWDNLLEHRSGEVCRKRWKQMVTHIGDYKIRSFLEQVEVLAQRYCPELLETREALDSRPLVP